MERCRAICNLCNLPSWTSGEVMLVERVCERLAHRTECADRFWLDQIVHYFRAKEGD